MNPLEKYAAKKKLTKKLLEKLYGKKPGKHTGTIAGAASGTVLGTGGGGVAGGIYKGRKATRATLDKVYKLMDADRPGAAIGASFAGIPLSIFETIGGAIQGGAAGAPTGAVLGALGGKAIDKVRMAKYLAKRKKTNIKLLAGGTAGAGGLAALLSQKEKRASKYPPPIAKKEFVQGSKPTPPKSKKPFLNKLTSGKFSILPGLSDTTQKRGGSKPALGARLQWRF